MNTDVYQTIAIVLQIAQAHNVTVPGGAKYNVPSGIIPTDPAWSTSGAGPAPNLTSYSTVAITGADDFRDGQTTVKDMFDTFVQITREITPTCMFSTAASYLFVSLTPLSHKSEPSGLVGTCRRKHFLRNYSDNILLSYTAHGWPTRSVEQLPPYNPQKLRNSILIIGNSVRTFYPLTRNYPIA